VRLQRHVRTLLAPEDRSAAPSDAVEHALAHIYVSSYARVVVADLAVLEVIAEPTRRRILDAVRGGERSVGELVDQVGMHQPGVSRHLKVLRDAGLVEVRRDAQRRLYRLRPEPLRELDAWLEPYRAEWAGRLDSLERHLRRSATSTPSGAEEHP
jgi:DNA-binding transcriptional ArsR family regulator